MDSLKVKKALVELQKVAGLLSADHNSHQQMEDPIHDVTGVTS
jgi:hypothetical protein